MAFPASHRPTREWPLLILALALVGAICIPLWQWTTASHDEDAVKWTGERLGRLFLGPEQIACYACFAWAGFILLGRYLEVRRQQRAFGLELLPEGQCILVEDSRDLQRRIDDRVGRRGPYMLASMLRLALGRFATSRNSRDVAEIVRTQADVDLGRLVSSMATVHYLAWAIPSIGFLGTVRGLAGSLSLGGETKVQAFIHNATTHLNVAFDCTLVALALSLVVMFLLHSVQREEEGLVIDCQQYCLEHLVSRLYEMTPESGESAVDPLSRRSTPRAHPIRGGWFHEPHRAGHQQQSCPRGGRPALAGAVAALPGRRPGRVAFSHQPGRKTAARRPARRRLDTAAPAPGLSRLPALPGHRARVVRRPASACRGVRAGPDIRHDSAIPVAEHGCRHGPTSLP